MIRAATDGVGVGFALSMLVVDEGWMIARSVVEAADPALSESESPQLLLVSTAGDSSSDLFGTYRGQALANLTDPTNTLLVEWSAPRSAAIDDRSAWRQASPVWTPRRESEIADKLGKVDPLELRQQYLNQWIDVSPGRAEAGEPAFDATEWAALGGEEPERVIIGAIESWPGAGTSAAIAGPTDTGQVAVSVAAFDSVGDAAAFLEPFGVEALVGKSLTNDPALNGLACKGIGSTTRACVADLRRLVDEGLVRHDDSAVLTEQVLAVRTVAGPDGPRVRSSGDASALKAATWAVSFARRSLEAPAIF
jgi:hypothetical protein